MSGLFCSAANRVSSQLRKHANDGEMAATTVCERLDLNWRELSPHVLLHLFPILDRSQREIIPFFSGGCWPDYVLLLSVNHSDGAMIGTFA